ncbi:MAG: hypothetical protein K2K57_02850 [Oscillospiraceae bacterium]|nr:hypothetical protein [Oscillospiraceae bacterium]
MKIIIDENPEYGKTGTLFGDFCIFADGFVFPYEEWTDFIFPVLDWWAEELVSKCGSNGTIRLMFMDGSYEMTGCIKGSKIYLECFSDHFGTGDMLGTIECTTEEFRKNLICGLKRCKRFFIQNGNKKEVEKCSEKIRRLEKIA